MKQRLWCNAYDTHLIPLEVLHFDNRSHDFRPFAVFLYSISVSIITNQGNQGSSDSFIWHLRNRLISQSRIVKLVGILFAVQCRHLAKYIAFLSADTAVRYSHSITHSFVLWTEDSRSVHRAFSWTFICILRMYQFNTPFRLSITHPYRLLVRFSGCRADSRATFLPAK